MQHQPATIDQAKQLGLLEEEYHKICDILGRQPNFTEISVFSVMWSEHCSYKNSIKWLKTLPRDGERLLVKAGEENAGLVDIGDGMGCVFKIESHNHPSAIEPFQGAATGVGGIHRDIFTMGARPIASLNSLRFGKLENPKTKHLLKGVVKGIGHYGNCFGVPTVGGEIYFEDCYQTNPLVNAMSVGIVKAGDTVSATSHGVGNPVFIVGAATGKDGIGGASFASADISENSAEQLPSVQVGDPFEEKKLLEACLEAIQTRSIIGMQDMGAAGITRSTSEMSAKGEHGMIIHLDKVPTRQANMKAWEMLLSESQEGMLVVIKKGEEQGIIDIFTKWDIHCVQIGEVTKEPILKFYMHDELVAEVPAESMVLGGGAPVYDRAYSRPAYFDKIEAFDSASIPVPSDLRSVAKQLANLPSIASKRWVYEQYDSMVGIGTTNTNAPSDASVIRLHNTEKALAATTDCNSRYVFADPYKGGMIAVSEAARNLVCSGATPVAITNCLNFGSPEDPGVMWQFAETVRGLADACLEMGLPVTGGNVSFYNQTGDVAILPTPVIGVLGVIDDVRTRTPMSYKESGLSLYLIGETKSDFAGSEWAYLHGQRGGVAPVSDIPTAMRLNEMLVAGRTEKVFVAAHDLSQGGLAAVLTEMTLKNNVGANVSLSNPAVDLLSETPGRVLVAVKDGAKVEALSAKYSIPVSKIGETGGDSLIINDANIPLTELRKSYTETFPKLFG